MLILVTGGAGYIGSHTIISLLENNYNVIVLDNLCNSSLESIKRVEKITNKKIKFYLGDVRDKVFLESIFCDNKIDAVIHFAALKSVGESNNYPLDYYSNNVTGTLSLLEVMKRFDVSKMIFSSSATVYGTKNISPNKETDMIGGTTNPYGSSKYMMELILQDFCKSESNFSIISLRYFNPTGAHSSGMLGENPNGIPNNLIPYISKVAQKKISKLQIFGNDYPTKDGTGIRDYIHVTDLAFGHVKSLDYIFSNDINYEVFNLGTGRGYSVLEVIRMFEKVSNTTIPFEFCERRAGDIAESWACADLAKNKLKWQAKKDLKEMLQDVWHWQIKNPNGY
ncbi:UDP-glucose 4-epimerase GalE [Salmonella enterica]|nr:UDP-glucose 4-epimerase GalE [Salmonella enterica]EDS6650505.1 UDP-glucose 4-epimerase GalE [Salmonella enterica subsp. arizonae]EAX0034982.1 UDP-glucose 4-epimerase GalE [Salmonella enterica]ECH4667525.1 UDP-glucose 4-epimerase GalE [Salmonella enterica]ECO5911130.1 UDP-glucose 4-epimerase GalE [Salmonella enterica]